MANVKLKSLTKTFGDVTALGDINIEVNDGEFFVLLGPTGAGKTTMLRLVAGLEKPDAGEIFLEGNKVNELTPAARDVAMVFQYYTLYPHYTVRQNLEFPLKSKLRNMPQDKIDKRIEEAAKTLKIEHLLDRETPNLSGGEMQRVGIGRAIVRTPKLFLMDEPLSNLDAKLREAMRSELSRLQMQLGQTFFYVTHDQVEAMTMADRIAVLNEGTIHQIASPDEIYNKPADTFVAKFVGSPPINLLEAYVKEGKACVGEDILDCQMTGVQKEELGSYDKDRVILGIRPEDIKITREQVQPENSFQSKIYFKQSMGAEDILNLQIKELVIQATVAPSLQTKVGENVYANIDMNRAHFFDIDTKERIKV
jgi:multiple sugar transport system ATP-binding protein